jgi:hypothetical protein
MARQPRIEFPGVPYHITSRGNARQANVLDDEDRGDKRGSSTLLLMSESLFP